MLKLLYNVQTIILSSITIIVLVAAEFPLKNPCLRTCSIDDITSSVLQKCIDQCKTLGHCCGNRINGECPDSSNQRLSCANGCEIAYYRSTVEQCKADCSTGNQSGCSYTHPNIKNPFSKCDVCQEGCNKWPSESACKDGCDLALSFPEYYQYVEIPDGGTCVQDDIPRFLFGGQSNMVGYSEQALPNSFRTMIKYVNSKKSKKKSKERLKELFLQAEAAEDHTSTNQARMIYNMKYYMKKEDMFFDHPTSTCSFTMPDGMDTLDCERPVSSTACGADHSQYGPEFMFAHVFPKLQSPLKGEKISIAKVAVGGKEIYKHWMKDNKDQNDNYWYALVDAIKGSNGTLEAFVWFQGESDSFHDWNRENYLDNLTKFVADVRQEIFDTSTKFIQPTDVPVVIVELGRWIWGVNTTVIEAQGDFVRSDPNAVLVKSGAGNVERKQLSQFYHYDLASQIIIGRRIANAMKKLLTN